MLGKCDERSQPWDGFAPDVLALPAGREVVRVNSWAARLNVKWWLLLVKHERRRGQYAQALVNLQKVIKIQPSRALAFVQAGFCLSKLGRYEEALRMHERALQLAPNYADAHANLGLVYCELGRQREALDSLNRAMRMKPSFRNDFYWVYMLGFICGKLELWDQALEAFKNANKLDEKAGNAWHGIGWAYANLGRDSEARVALERAISLEPGNAPAHRDLGDTYLKLHQFKEAVEQFQECIKLSPDDPGWVSRPWRGAL